MNFQTGSHIEKKIKVSHDLQSKTYSNGFSKSLFANRGITGEV